MAPGPPDLGATSSRWGEKAIRIALFLAAAISILTTLGILVALLRETMSFFGEVSIWNFLTDGQWAPVLADQYGIWQLVKGTFLITGIAVLLAIPLGLGIRDLPLRVRDPTRPQARQAGARGAGRGPDDHLRLLRPHLHHP